MVLLVAPKGERSETVIEIVLSSIIDFSQDYSCGEKFEQSFCEYQKALETAIQSSPACLELKKIFVQFQYGIGSTPSATKGFKVDRYSKKYQHICASIEVKKVDFDRLPDSHKSVHLGTSLIEILRLIEAKMRGKIPNELVQLIEVVAILNQKLTALNNILP
jgi:hypothetical protein